VFSASAASTISFIWPITLGPISISASLPDEAYRASMNRASAPTGICLFRRPTTALTSTSFVLTTVSRMKSLRTKFPSTTTMTLPTRARTRLGRSMTPSRKRLLTRYRRSAKRPQPMPRTRSWSAQPPSSAGWCQVRAIFRRTNFRRSGTSVWTKMSRVVSRTKGAAMICPRTTY
jgi:hypothetical protein